MVGLEIFVIIKHQCQTSNSHNSVSFVSPSSVKPFYFTESLLICYNPAWLVLRSCEIEMSTIQASSIQHSSSNVGVEEYRTASAGTSVGVC